LDGFFFALVSPVARAGPDIRVRRPAGRADSAPFHLVAPQNKRRRDTQTIALEPLARHLPASRPFLTQKPLLKPPATLGVEIFVRRRRHNRATVITA